MYNCLARDFVEPQLKGPDGAGSVVVTLIEMQDDAEVVHVREPLTLKLVDQLKKRGRKRAKSHGNYLPALDKAIEFLRENARNETRLLLLFFSDGAPSDQHRMECEHGVKVWQEDAKANPKLGHLNSREGWRCRSKLVDDTSSECVRRVQELGRLFGQDRTIIGTIAFGPPSEEFHVLKKMSEALPRGVFQKLGLQAFWRPPLRPSRAV